MSTEVNVHDDTFNDKWDMGPTPEELDDLIGLMQEIEEEWRLDMAECADNTMYEDPDLFEKDWADYLRRRS